MILFGGATAGGHQALPMNDLWEFDIVKHEWKELLPEGPTPVGRAYHTMFQFHHWSFIFGGATFSGPDWEYGSTAASATYYGDFWVYDPTIGLRGVWKKLAEGASGMPTARHSMSTGFQNGNAYVFGGDSAAGVLNDLYMYTPDESDITQGVWQQLISTGSRLGPAGTLPLPRSAHSAVILDDSNMYVYGGQHNSTYFLGDLWKYDLPLNEWVQVQSIGCGANPTGPTGYRPYQTPDMVWTCGSGPTARSGHAASPVLMSGSGPSIYGAMVVMGGRIGPTSYENTVWFYHRGKNVWQERSAYCEGILDHNALDTRGRQTQCINRDTHQDRVRPQARWRHTIIPYHNRTQESAYYGTQIYMFGGSSATYGALDNGWSVESNQVRGMKDLWIYHV